MLTSILQLQLNTAYTWLCINNFEHKAQLLILISKQNKISVNDKNENFVQG